MPMKKRKRPDVQEVNPQTKWIIIDVVVLAVTVALAVAGKIPSFVSGLAVGSILTSLYMIGSGKMRM